MRAAAHGWRRPAHAAVVCSAAVSAQAGHVGRCRCGHADADAAASSPAGASSARSRNQPAPAPRRNASAVTARRNSADCAATRSQRRLADGVTGETTILRAHPPPLRRGRRAAEQANAALRRPFAATKWRRCRTLRAAAAHREAQGAMRHGRATRECRAVQYELVRMADGANACGQGSDAPPWQD